jgi:hypothetical protein
MLDMPRSCLLSIGLCDIVWRGREGLVLFVSGWPCEGRSQTAFANDPMNESQASAGSARFSSLACLAGFVRVTGGGLDDLPWAKG